MSQVGFCVQLQQYGEVCDALIADDCQFWKWDTTKQAQNDLVMMNTENHIEVTEIADVDTPSLNELEEYGNLHDGGTHSNIK